MRARALLAAAAALLLVAAAAGASTRRIRQASECKPNAKPYRAVRRRRHARRNRRRAHRALALAGRSLGRVGPGPRRRAPTPPPPRPPTPPHPRHAQPKVVKSPAPGASASRAGPVYFSWAAPKARAGRGCIVTLQYQVVEKVAGTRAAPAPGEWEELDAAAPEPIEVANGGGARRKYVVRARGRAPRACPEPAQPRPRRRACARAPG